MSKTSLMSTSLEQKPAIKNGKHALVIGGSIAGLLAARVLINHFERVTIVERDRLPEQPIPCQGVPQSSHVHVLLTQGQRILEQLFPGVGRDYPPNDEAGFLSFARDLRSPVIYEAIKDAQPLSPIYSYRGTENRLYHYEELSKLPSGLVVLGDAACAFNPVYGQGMTVAALGALTLDGCLHQQLRGENGSLKGLTQRFQKRLAKVNANSWLMATGEDLRWPNTEGGQSDRMSRLMQRYIDQVLILSLDHPQIYQTFGEVVHMLKDPTTLFQPRIMSQVLWQAMGRIFHGGVTEGSFNRIIRNS